MIDTPSIGSNSPVYFRDGTVGTLDSADYDAPTGRLLTLWVLPGGCSEPVSVPAELATSSEDGIYLDMALSDPLQGTPCGPSADSTPAAYITPGAEGGRPLWHRSAARLEPLRPAFTWAVEHPRLAAAAGGAALAIVTGTAAYLAARK